MPILDTNAIVTNIEYTHDVRAIQSDAKGLFYLEDDGNKDIGILVVRNGVPMHVVLNRNQALTLAKEFKEVCRVRYNML